MNTAPTGHLGALAAQPRNEQHAPGHDQVKGQTSGGQADERGQGDGGEPGAAGEAVDAGRRVGQGQGRDSFRGWGETRPATAVIQDLADVKESLVPSFTS